MELSSAAVVDVDEVLDVISSNVDFFLSSSSLSFSVVYLVTVTFIGTCV